MTSQIHQVENQNLDLRIQNISIIQLSTIKVHCPFGIDYLFNVIRMNGHTYVSHITFRLLVPILGYVKRVANNWRRITRGVRITLDF